MIPSLFASVGDYNPYAGIGSRETPADTCEEMALIASALEKRGFTLRSGFAGGADTAFELGTVREDLREIFAPWPGFGANPNSKWDQPRWDRSEEHTSELQSLMRTSYAVFCLQKQNTTNKQQH